MNGPDDGAVPRVSVIIPHLNTPALLARCLRSVTAQQLDRGHAEIIVVDNGSSISLDAVRAEFPGVNFLLEPEPGPGLARNRGALVAAAPVLAFIDADCRASPQWLQAAVDAVEPDLESAVVGGDIRIDYADPERLTAVEAFETVFGFRQKMYIEQQGFSVTANLATSPQVWRAIGPFGGIDIAEDREWGRRGKALGYPTRFDAQMLVYHPARDDFAALVRKWQRLIQHDYNEHIAARRPLWRWYAKAVALIASVPVHGAQLMASPRLSGLPARFAGLGVLARHRLFRAREMLKAATAPGGNGSAGWNR